MRCALILILLASSLFAQEATRFELKAEELPTPGTYWYGLYMIKNKVGWLRDTISRTKEGRIDAVFEMRMQVTGPGGVMKMHMNQTLVFDAKPPYRLYSGTSINDMGAGVTKTVFTRAEKGYKATITKPSGTKDEVVELDFVLADKIGAEIWIQRGGLKVGDRITAYAFEMDELRVGTATLVLKEIRIGMIGGVRQRIYVGHASSSRMGDMGTVRATDNGKLLSMALGGAMELRREPEEIAKKLDAAVDMFALASVAVDKPLGDPSTITELVVEARGAGADNLESGPRQSVTAGDKPDTRIVKIGAAHGHRLKATEKEREDALEVNRRYPAKDATVAAVAAKAIGDAATAQDKVARLVTFVAKYVEDEYGPEYTSALDVIHGKKGDCSAHATLFVGLARAAGIPAREIFGYVYIGDEARALGGHAWCEVILDGHWVEVDPTWNEVEINPTHISMRGKHTEMDLLRVLGQLSLHVVSIKRK